VNIYVHHVTSGEFKRWLERQGATFEPAKGGHLWVMLRGRRTILPMQKPQGIEDWYGRRDQEAAWVTMRMECG
jgi:hypothetical protein